MNKSTTIGLAVLIGLFVSPMAMGWYYDYGPSHVIHHPVVTYEPQVVTTTSTFGGSRVSFSVSSSRVVYEPVIERGCYDRTIIIEQPRPVTRVVEVYRHPAPRTVVVVPPRRTPSHTVVVQRPSRERVVAVNPRYPRGTSVRVRR